jgi:predicted hydrocarbon binding protein
MKERIWWPILKKLRYKKGKLEFVGISYITVPAEILPTLSRDLSKIVGVAAKGIIYQGAFEQAYKVVEKALKLNLVGYIIAKLGIGRIKIEKKVLEIVQGEGLGRVEIVKEGKLEKGETIVGRVYNSFEAQFYGKSKKPVCAFLMGNLAGGASMVWGEEVIVEEKKCAAMGHEYCEFEAKLKRFL